MKLFSRRSTLVLVLLAVTGCSPYMGEPRVPRTDFRATLEGASVVPPVETKASGWFEAVYRPSTKVVEYRLNLVGLSGPVTMAYLHGPAPAGQNAPQVVPINPPFYSDGSTISDGVTLTREQADELLAGNWYISVRTAKYPEGEIRGQIVAQKK